MFQDPNEGAERQPGPALPLQLHNRSQKQEEKFFVASPIDAQLQQKQHFTQWYYAKPEIKPDFLSQMCIVTDHTPLMMCCL